MKAEQATFVRSGSRADKSTTCENPEQDVISSFRFRRPLYGQEFAAHSDVTVPTGRAISVSNPKEG